MCYAYIYIYIYIYVYVLLLFMLYYNIRATQARIAASCQKTNLGKRAQTLGYLNFQRACCSKHTQWFWDLRPSIWLQTFADWNYENWPHDTLSRVCAVKPHYTRSPLEDSRLFGPSSWKILAATNEKDISEQPSPWRKSSKRESCYGDRVYMVRVCAVKPHYMVLLLLYGDTAGVENSQGLRLGLPKILATGRVE